MLGNTTLITEDGITHTLFRLADMTPSSICNLLVLSQHFFNLFSPNNRAGYLKAHVNWISLKQMYGLIRVA